MNSTVESLPVGSHVQPEDPDAVAEIVGAACETEEPVYWHQSTFNAENLASGMYIYHLSVGKFNATGKMVLVK